MPSSSKTEPIPSSAISLLLFVCPLLLFLIIAPEIPQSQGYHNFADHRRLLGVANFWNVISNVPFVFVGVLGLRAFRDAASRVLFAGVFLTAFGSGYYHLAPDDHRLAWDRLPMTLVFMALLAIVIGEWMGAKWRTRLLAPLIAFGVLSVVWWVWTGDLRVYAIAQFGPALLLAPAMYFHAGIRKLWPVVALYVAAKVAEMSDVEIYSTLPLSGHTIKHFLAALGTYFIYRWNAAR